VTIPYETFVEAVHAPVHPVTWNTVGQLMVVGRYFFPLDRRKYHAFMKESWEKLHAMFCAWDRDEVLKEENRFINVHIEYHEKKLEHAVRGD
jgi:hypothetical protein